MNSARYNYGFYMVFDVESIGLHGEGFAVAFGVFDDNGKVYDKGEFACHPDRAFGHINDRKWVNDNVPMQLATHESPIDVREAFWEKWVEWKGKGAALVADCGWPVEGRFLEKCIDDDAARRWEGPYPLLDLASVLIANGQDPLCDRPRLPDELPKHDPAADVRQTARLFLEGLK